MLDKKSILLEIQTALLEVQQFRNGAEHDDCSDQPEHLTEKAVARLITTLERFAPPRSYYAKRCADEAPPHLQIQSLPGILEALKEDIERDRLVSIAELVHADVFSDFLDMAQHLLDQNYKDAAAVIAGSSLEAHLRALCTKHGVATVDASGKSIMASRLNADLDAAGAYGASKTDLKSVTAWLDTRNHAAHGQYAKYEASQVGIVIAAIRDFMTRRPA
jgi:hypothetical protein